MATDPAELEIAASPGAVWGVSGVFGGLGRYSTGISEVSLEGDDRIVAGEREIPARLLERDDFSRRLRYGSSEGLPAQRHEATITVTPSGTGAMGIWAVDVAPDGMATGTAEIDAGALQGPPYLTA